MTLSNLSRAQKQSLLRVADKVERAKKARAIENYRPHSGAWRGEPNDGQLGFHKSDARVRLLLGGNQSGKTIAGIVESIWTALGIHPYRRVRVPNRGRIVASLGFEEGAGQVIVPKILEWLPKNVLAKPPKNNQAGIPAHWELVNGSTFNILSGEQETKVFEGWTGDWAWVDEPCRRDIYEATRRGLIRQKGRMWMTMTPLAEPWLYNDLWMPAITGERQDVKAFIIDTYDNCVDNGGFLDRAEIEAFESDIPEDLKETRIHGKFRHLSGRVYPEFDAKIHVVEPFPIPPHWFLYEGIDPHLKKPHAFAQWAVDPREGDVYVTNELFAAITIPDLAEAILKLRAGRQPMTTLIDTSSETPDSVYRLTPRRVLEQKGIRTKLVNKNVTSVMHGIHVLKEWLTPRKNVLGEKKPSFYVFSNCKRHIKEFMNYVWDDRDDEYNIKDKPRKTYDDMMDLCRYFATENLKVNQKETAPVRVSNFRYGRH